MRVMKICEKHGILHTKQLQMQFTTSSEWRKQYMTNKHVPKDHKGPDIKILITYKAIQRITINQEPSQKKIIRKPFY